MTTVERDQIYRVNYVSYLIEDSKPVVYVIGRDRSGNRDVVKIYDFYPYFYVSTDTARKIPMYPWIRMEETDKISILGSPVVRIYCQTPSQVPRTKELIMNRGYLTYEADILFKYVYMKDTDLISGYRKIDDHTIVPIDCNFSSLLVLYLSLIHI